MEAPGMTISLRRIPFHTLLELMLLLTALSALVTGAGAKIGGAEAKPRRRSS